jgi:hypothetical protein
VLRVEKLKIYLVLLVENQAAGNTGLSIQEPDVRTTSGIRNKRYSFAIPRISRPWRSVESHHNTTVVEQTYCKPLDSLLIVDQRPRIQ